MKSNGVSCKYIKIWKNGTYFFFSFRFLTRNSSSLKHLSLLLDLLLDRDLLPLHLDLFLDRDLLPLDLDLFLDRDLLLLFLDLDLLLDRDLLSLSNDLVLLLDSNLLPISENSRKLIKWRETTLSFLIEPLGATVPLLKYSMNNDYLLNRKVKFKEIAFAMNV